MTKLRTYLFFLVIVALLISLCDARHHRKYMVRKGSRLSKLHVRTLKTWRENYNARPHRRHKRKRHHHHHKVFPFDEVLTQMDSYLRPRFG
uniref:Secreted protein n=1 Tax=Panagrellus redivivus TaxID=6233 RepID=A0A7E4ZUG7_PANRE